MLCVSKCYIRQLELEALTRFVKVCIGASYKGYRKDIPINLRPISERSSHDSFSIPRSVNKNRRDHCANKGV